MVEDENGNIVRETMKDTDTLARYKTMHETLVYLCNLDHEDTEQQMLDKLRLQVKPVSPHDSGIRNDVSTVSAQGCVVCRPAIGSWTCSSRCLASCGCR